MSKSAMLALERRAETAEDEADRLREVIRTAISDLRADDGTVTSSNFASPVWHDAHTTLADWLAVQVVHRRPCPLLALVAERPVLPEAV